jgi:hypothetical protein
MLPFNIPPKNFTALPSSLSDKFFKTFYLVHVNNYIELYIENIFLSRLGILSLHHNQLKKLTMWDSKFIQCGVVRVEYNRVKVFKDQYNSITIDVGTPVQMALWNGAHFKRLPR